MALLLVVVVMSGCGGSAPLPTATPRAAAELTEGDHAAGLYTFSPFQPRIQVALPDDRWTTFHLTHDFFDVAVEADDGPVVVMFLDPIAFLDADEEDAQAATPQEAIALLGAHAGTTLTEPRVVEIGGLSGLEVDAEFAIDDTHVIRVSGGNIGFGPNSDVRLAFLEADAGLLVIGLAAPAGRMAEAEELTQAVRDSISID
ncbi:MAG TPA: hypothetical protein VFY43_09115 [Candidatus Limnocylindria bacterium]|nr:hypothetical protein [Candidatus Limnocylindria bacterium]